MKNIMNSLVAGTAMLFAAGLSAQASEFVVIEADDKAGFAQGDVIADGASITIPSGSSLTLISEDGMPVTLPGPFSGVPKSSGSGGNSDLSVLASLLSNSNKSTVSLGVVRAAGSKKDDSVPSPYLVNVDVSGARCLPSDGTIVLYRSDASETTTLKLTEMIGNKEVRSSKGKWKAGDNQMSLPRKMVSMFKDDSNWKFVTGDNSVDLNFHAMPSSLDNATKKAIWLAEQGCKPQAIALLSNLR